MHTLSMDFETFSAADITKCGSYAYINDPSFEPLLLSWSIDGGEVETIDFTAEGLGPAYKLIKYLENPEYLKTAYNVAFEHEVFRRIFGINFPIEQWQDTMILAAYAGLPRRLAEVGKALGLPEDKQKMKEGAALIRYFCIPFKGKRRMPSDSPERWQTFIEYNRQDVVTEMTIRNLLLEGFPLPKREQKLWVMDQKINDFGVGIDLPFVEAAIDLANKEKDRLTAEAIQISGLENPNSVSQLKQWLGLDEGATLRKADVADMLQTVTDETKKRVLQIRQQLGKSSVSKFDAMARSACPDGRVRGSLAFYGANRSGRWAGRLIQPQNFRQNHIGDGSPEDLAYARKLVEQRDAESIRHFFGDVSDTLSQLTRTALRPRRGHMFAVADFSAIEARVIAWLADEKWRMDTFLKGGDIYCASASQMFHVPVVKNGVNGELRQKGKIAELALGYSGSVGALTNMGALSMGLKEEELPEIVEKWREASPRIVALWYKMNDAMLNAINDGETTGIAKGVAIIPEVRSGIPVIAMKLPSGRSLYYVRPAIGVNRFGGASITYEGYETGKWGRVETFGGKGVENCVAEGTPVLTDHGLVPIEDITAEMRIWDGRDWVSHGGLIDKGIQNVIRVNGIDMTPEHKILTEEGWVECGKADGLNWANVPLPDMPETWPEHQGWSPHLDLPLCLWQRGYTRNRRFAGQKIPGKILRLHEKQAFERVIKAPRDESSSGIRGLAFHETAVHFSHTPCMAQLRRARNHGMRPMVAQLRKLLGRHGANVAKRAGSGSHRQQQRLLPGELPLGTPNRQFQQHPSQCANQYPVGSAHYRGGQPEVRNRNYHDPLPHKVRVARGSAADPSGLQAHVYDIRNCGPRHRFAVINEESCFLVHNCVQAIARDCLARAMYKVMEHYQIVFHVHDEMIVEVPEDQADKALEDMLDIMAEPIPWAPGLVLKGAGYTCPYYYKD